MSEFRWRRWILIAIAASGIFVVVLCSGVILFRNAARASRQQWLRQKIRSGDIPADEIDDHFLEGEAFSPEEIESLKDEARRLRERTPEPSS